MMTTGAEVITTIHLAILAILALLVIAGIAWGSRLRRRRRAGTERREEHQALVEAAPTTNTAPRQAQAQEQSQTQEQARVREPDMGMAAAEPAPPPPSGTLGEPDRMVDAPIHSAAIGDASPAPEATAVGAGRVPCPADQPVTVLKGLGPKLAARLGELGIATVGDIAALDPGRAEALDAQLGVFTGRMARDRWIEQARLLAAGDRAGFEAAFGKL